MAGPTEFFDASSMDLKTAMEEAYSKVKTSIGACQPRAMVFRNCVTPCVPKFLQKPVKVCQQNSNIWHVENMTETLFIVHRTPSSEKVCEVEFIEDPAPKVSKNKMERLQDPSVFKSMCLKKLTKDATRTTYFTNVDAPKKDEHTRQMLEATDSFSHLKDLQKMPGVNVPTYYVNPKLDGWTAGPAHIEDGCLPSFNVMLAGKPKVWIVCSSSSLIAVNGILRGYNKKARAQARIEPSKEFAGQIFDRLIEMQTDGELDDQEMKDKIQELTMGFLSEMESGVDEDFHVGCSCPLNHRIYFLTPELLEKYVLPYDLFVQYPGDLVFINSSCIHQVVAAGGSICLAVNCSKIEVDSQTPNMDFCELGQTAPIRDMAKNKILRRFVIKPGRNKRSVLYCEYCSVHVPFKTKREQVKHYATKHPSESKPVLDKLKAKKRERESEYRSRKRLDLNKAKKCPHCSKTFADRSNLHHHVKSVHDRVKSKCPECKIELNSKRLSVHLREIHGMCPKCRTEHDSEDECSEISCPLCRQVFSSYSSFTLHKKFNHL